MTEGWGSSSQPTAMMYFNPVGQVLALRVLNQEQGVPPTMQDGDTSRLRACQDGVWTPTMVLVEVPQNVKQPVTFHKTSMAQPNCQRQFYTSPLQQVILSDAACQRQQPECPSSLQQTTTRLPEASLSTQNNAWQSSLPHASHQASPPLMRNHHRLGCQLSPAAPGACIDQQGQQMKTVLWDDAPAAYTPTSSVTSDDGLSFVQSSLNSASETSTSPADDSNSNISRAASLSRCSEGITPDMWWQCFDVHGCHTVQRRLEEAATEEERLTVAFALRGHVMEALHSKHANYVLQKCIAVLEPTSCQFIIDEIMGSDTTHLVTVAQHPFGCRILQRLLEHCSAAPQQLHGLVEVLFANASSLITHEYGNYVMQQIVERCSLEHRVRLARILQLQVRQMSKGLHGGAVIAAALQHAPPHSRLALARAIVKDEGVLAILARKRYSSVSAKRVLDILPNAELSEAVQQLLSCKEWLRRSRYGRSVALYLQGFMHVVQEEGEENMS